MLSGHGTGLGFGGAFGIALRAFLSVEKVPLGWFNQQDTGFRADSETEMLGKRACCLLVFNGGG